MGRRLDAARCDGDRDRLAGYRRLEPACVVARRLQGGIREGIPDREARRRAREGRHAVPLRKRDQGRRRRVYPSKFDKTVNIGLVASEYSFSPSKDPEYPHRRRVDWKTHLRRPQFSKPALDEINSAITLFLVRNNTDEFIAALEGMEVNPDDVDAATAVDTAAQAQESIDDFVVKRLVSRLNVAAPQIAVSYSIYHRIDKPEFLSAIGAS